MKYPFKNLIIAHFIFLTVQNMFGQLNNGVVTYKISLNAKTENTINIGDGINVDNATLKEMTSIIENSQDVYGKLVFNQFESTYRLNEELKNEVNKSYNLTRPAAGGEKIFYTNLEKDIFIEQDCQILGTCFLIKNELPAWNLKNESRVIDGLLCKKAELINPKYNDRITVWYAPELPIPYGPLNYFGLPGLIIVLKSKVVTFVATDIRLNKVEFTDLLKKPTKGKSINKEDFLKLVRSSSSYYDNN